MRSLLAPSLAGVMLLPSIALALPAEVRVVAKDTNRGVPSTLLLRVNGVEIAQTVDTDDNGSRALPQPCTPALEIKARPLTGEFFGDGRWRPCDRTPLPIPVKPSGSRKALMDMVALNIPQARKSRLAFSSAFASGDLSAQGVYGNEVAARLRQAGEVELSKAYATAAIASGVVALQKAGVEMPDDPLVFDAQQNAWVSKQETLDALAKFQASAGVPVSQTGARWDGRTFQAIQNLQAAQPKDDLADAPPPDDPVSDPPIN